MTRQATDLAVSTLLVRHGPAWAAEHRYVLDFLLGEQLGLCFQEERVAGLQSVEIRCPQAPAARALRLGANLLLRPKEQWLTSAAMPKLPLAQWEPGPVLPDWNLGPLPVLYPAADSGAGSVAKAQELFLPLDVLGGAFFLLTRYEELVEKGRDKHQRFPATNSVAHKAGFLLRPIVDEYAELLRVALQRCFPGLKCRQRPPRIRLSHDVDHPFQFFGKTLPQMALSAGKHLAHHPQPGEAWSLLRAGVSAGLRRNASVDPFNTFESLMQASEALGTPGEFYFMTGATSRRYDESYDLAQPELQELLRQINARGHRLGLHASYDSFLSEEALRQELDALRRGAEQAGVRLESTGGRQHYLRWEHGTWRCWNRTGMDYDGTVGFSDHIGFRCGTAQEFTVFDPVEGRQLQLRERPLVAMDVTLMEYMALTPEGLQGELAKLWRRVRRVGGTLEVLIHNSNPAAAWMARTAAELPGSTAE